MIFNYFASNNSKYDSKYNNVITFYSKAIESLEQILTQGQVKKIKKILESTSLSKKTFFYQWYEYLAKDFIKMSKNKKSKEIMHTIDKICKFYDYEEFYCINKLILKYSKEHDIPVNDIEYGDEYPNEIIW